MKQIKIIGGSLAGSAIARLLALQGHDVTVLDRKERSSLDEGSGIVLPEAIIQKCIDLQLFDTNIPRIPISKRNFIRKQPHATADHDVFWTQPFSAMALNWNDVYLQLRKRIPDTQYRINNHVERIVYKHEQFTIETASEEIHHADFIISADGVESITRAHFLPENVKHYAGYIAWRGTIEVPASSQDALDELAITSVFKNGHFLCYPIPAPDSLHSKKILLNWLMYTPYDEKALPQLLVDQKGHRHAHSLPRGTLTDKHLTLLHTLANDLLPAHLAAYITHTNQPFIQVIYDFVRPEYKNNQIIFIGDSAATLRPHSGSGVLKALVDAIEFTEYFKANPSKSPLNIVAEWKALQRTRLLKDTKIAQCMGDALVNNTPDWSKMDGPKMETWWKYIMAGQNWYPTPQAENPYPFFSDAPQVAEQASQLTAKL